MATSLPSLDVFKERASQWLMQGISPQRLALTLSLGFVLGCLPLVGLTTALCAMIALAFRLNQPAIQAANYAAMPFQVALLVPFMRLGGKLTPFHTSPALDLGAMLRSPFQLLTHSSTQVAAQLGILTGQALLAWLVVAIPVAACMTLALTGVFRRVPALATVRVQNSTRL